MNRKILLTLPENILKELNKKIKEEGRISRQEYIRQLLIRELGDK
jgi:metal-responsive CopG/Arc/MetJ family transcriptional regulator